MIYELKVAAGFVPEHDARAIHYAALLGTDRVKLLDFRTAKVMGRLTRSPFAQLDRTKVSYTGARWQALSDCCVALKQHLHALLADWGAYLETPLYEEGRPMTG